MVITYHGGECYKATFADTTIVFNPPAKRSTFSPVKFGADIALVSMHHSDFDGTDEVTFGTKRPFIIDGPGEYEVGEMTARGFGIKTNYDGVERFNTIYQVRLEGITILFLGALGDGNIDPQILGEIEDIDILCVPIGGGDVLDVVASAKLATKLEPRVILPMHYTETDLTAFLKESGTEGVMPVDKFTVKKKDLGEMESRIVILRT